jgi:hypothetical protein
LTTAALAAATALTTATLIAAALTTTVTAALTTTTISCKGSAFAGFLFACGTSGSGLFGSSSRSDRDLLGPLPPKDIDNGLAATCSLDIRGA